MRKYVGVAEVYPVYGIQEEGIDPDDLDAFHSVVKVDINEAHLEWINEVWLEWEAVQHFLEKKYEESKRK